MPESIPRNCHQRRNPCCSAGESRRSPPESMLHHMATSSIGRRIRVCVRVTWTSIYSYTRCACGRPRVRARARGMHTRARARSWPRHVRALARKMITYRCTRLVLAAVLDYVASIISYLSFLRRRFYDCRVTFGGKRDEDIEIHSVLIIQEYMRDTFGLWSICYLYSSAFFYIFLHFFFCLRFWIVAYR